MGGGGGDLKAVVNACHTQQCYVLLQRVCYRLQVKARLCHRRLCFVCEDVVGHLNVGLAVVQGGFCVAQR